MTDVLIPPPPPPPSFPPHPRPLPASSWTTARIVAIVFGSILSIAGLGVVTAGGVIGVAAATERDDAGYFHTGNQQLTTRGFALTSDAIDLGDEARSDAFIADMVNVQLRATSSDPSSPVFIGVARTSDVDGYLRNVAHDVVSDLHGDRFDVDYRTVNGEASPARPQDQTFWDASSAGTGEQTVRWTPRHGDWTVVVMNADARRIVTADFDAGVAVRHLKLIVGILLATGIAMLAAGLALVIVNVRRGRTPVAVMSF